jgi:hypothetical protein
MTDAANNFLFGEGGMHMASSKRPPNKYRILYPIVLIIMHRLCIFSVEIEPETF